MQKITICKMSKEDIDSIDTIDKCSFPIPWRRSSFEEEMNNIFAKYLVAKIDGEVVGYIGMWFIMDECHVMNIAVHPDYRRIGVASELIKEMIKLCKIDGISYILLEVRTANTPAQKLYESFGFKKDGIRKNYYSNPDGTHDDAILMSKEF